MVRSRILAVLALAAALGGTTLVRAADDATPSASAPVTREPLSSEAVAHMAGNAGPLDLTRVHVPAGAETVIGPDEAEVLVLAIESGAAVVDSPAAMMVQRAPMDGQSQKESVAAGSSVALAPGDSLVSLDPAGTHVRNPGPDAASVLSIGLRSSAVREAQAAATPGAERGLVLALALVMPPPCPPGTEPGSPSLAATPGGGGGGGGAGGVALAVAAAPACIDVGATPVP
jgi:hypothetical protein